MASPQYTLGGVPITSPKQISITELAATTRRLTILQRERENSRNTLVKKLPYEVRQKLFQHLLLDPHLGRIEPLYPYINPVELVMAGQLPA